MADRDALPVAAAVELLRAGAVLAYPTEGVWGLGCSPAQAGAVRRLLAAKRRDAARGLILIAARAADLRDYIAPLQAAERRLLASRPHTTWLAPARGAHELLRGAHDRQAVRITRHPVCRALCRGAGALVSTSANREGEPPAASAAAARALFGAEIDGVVAGALGDAAGPSEIRDLASGEVLRPAARA